ncbi:MAG: hypothetical protein RI891_1400, partial [Gemmatimonadota bacterium]
MRPHLRTLVGLALLGIGACRPASTPSARPTPQSVQTPSV